MSAPWYGTSTPAASTVASVVAPAVTSSGTGLVPRCRTFSASVAGTTTTSSTLQVSDGSTVILSLDVAPPSGGGTFTIMSSGVFDYRSSVSASGVANSLTIGFASGVAGITQKVNAAGDFVALGVAAFAMPQQS